MATTMTMTMTNTNTNTNTVHAIQKGPSNNSNNLYEDHQHNHDVMMDDSRNINHPEDNAIQNTNTNTNNTNNDSNNDRDSNRYEMSFGSFSPLAPLTPFNPPTPSIIRNGGGQPEDGALDAQRIGGVELAHMFNIVAHPNFSAAVDMDGDNTNDSNSRGYDINNGRNINDNNNSGNSNGDRNNTRFRNSHSMNRFPSLSDSDGNGSRSFNDSVPSFPANSSYVDHRDKNGHLANPNRSSHPDPPPQAPWVTESSKHPPIQFFCDTTQAIRQSHHSHRLGGGGGLFGDGGVWKGGAGARDGKT